MMTASAMATIAIIAVCGTEDDSRHANADESGRVEEVM